MTLENSSAKKTAAQMATEIFLLDAEGRKTGPAVATAAPDRTAWLEPGRQARLAQSLTVPAPKRWRLSTPQRYAAVTTVTEEGRPVDVTETPFGIRTIAFDATRGFFLNGEHVPLQGVCDHHDLGALGSALNVRALERQL